MTPGGAGTEPTPPLDPKDHTMQNLLDILDITGTLHLWRSDATRRDAETIVRRAKELNDQTVTVEAVMLAIPGLDGAVCPAWKLAVV